MSEPTPTVVSTTVPAAATGGQIDAAKDRLRQELAEAGGNLERAWFQFTGQDDGTSLLSLSDGPNPWDE
jgi:hypothetical protein